MFKDGVCRTYGNKPDKDRSFLSLCASTITNLAPNDIMKSFSTCLAVCGIALSPMAAHAATQSSVPNANFAFAGQTKTMEEFQDASNSVLIVQRINPAYGDALILGTGTIVKDSKVKDSRLPKETWGVNRIVTAHHVSNASYFFRMSDTTGLKSNRDEDSIHDMMSDKVEIRSAQSGKLIGYGVEVPDYYHHMQASNEKQSERDCSVMAVIPVGSDYQNIQGAEIAKTLPNRITMMRDYNHKAPDHGMSGSGAFTSYRGESAALTGVVSLKFDINGDYGIKELTDTWMHNPDTHISLLKEAKENGINANFFPDHQKSLSLIKQGVAASMATRGDWVALAPLSPHVLRDLGRNPSDYTYTSSVTSGAQTSLYSYPDGVPVKYQGVLHNREEAPYLIQRILDSSGIKLDDKTGKVVNYEPPAHYIQRAEDTYGSDKNHLTLAQRFNRMMYHEGFAVDETLPVETTEKYRLFAN